MAKDTRRQREIMAVLIAAGVAAVISEFVLGPTLRQKLGVGRGR